MPVCLECDLLAKSKLKSEIDQIAVKLVQDTVHAPQPPKGAKWVHTSIETSLGA